MAQQQPIYYQGAILRITPLQPPRPAFPVHRGTPGLSPSCYPLQTSSVTGALTRKTKQGPVSIGAVFPIWPPARASELPLYSTPVSGPVTPGPSSPVWGQVSSARIFPKIWPSSGPSSSTARLLGVYADGSIPSGPGTPDLHLS